MVGEPGRAAEEADVARSKLNTDFGIGTLQTADMKNRIVTQGYGENRGTGFFFVHVAM
jgi:hypothetical protein